MLDQLGHRQRVEGGAAARKFWRSKSRQEPGYHQRYKRCRHLILFVMVLKHLCSRISQILILSSP